MSEGLREGSPRVFHIGEGVPCVRLRENGQNEWESMELNG